MKKIISLVLSLTLIMGSVYSEIDLPSDWALEFVELISEQNILEEAFFNDYGAYVTRGEFAYLGVKLYEYYTGQTAEIGDASFTDTEDEWALKAKNIGFVSGYPAGDFLPEREIKREELAVLFVNLFDMSGISYDQADIQVFTDDQTISSWAREAVYIARENGIVNGVGYNNFDPLGKATKEQSLIMFSQAQTSENLVYTGLDEDDTHLEVEKEPEFIVSKSVIELGEYTTITAKNIKNPELLYIEQNLNELIKFIKVQEEYVAVIPATYYTNLDTYIIDYGLEGYLDKSVDIEVVDRTFSIQHLTVSSSTTAATQTTTAYDEYNAYYKTALLKNVFIPEWDIADEPAFILPVDGRLTTEYGQTRYVNGAPTSYNHAGFDIATDKGTEVVSTFKGQVVLAKSLILTGNSVVVNHGNGIFSTYFHMDSFDVAEGDIVQTGQKVGEVGSTGYSTGPHLHFSISFYKQNLEPGYFIYGEQVTYDNYRTLFDQE